MERYQQFHDKSFVMDGLFPQPINQENIDVATEGGVDGVQQTLISHADDFYTAVDKIQQELNMISQTSGCYQATSVEELRDGDGVGVVFGFQNSTPLERDRNAEKNVRFFEKLGVKVVQMTYNDRNYAGSGCTHSNDDGLSDFGYDVIEAIENNGMILDLSHAGPQTAADALEASTQPAIFSHANPKRVRDYCRNISDELIKATVDTGGTVGVARFAPMVSDDPTVEDLVDHIEYLVELIGAENVTLGLDIGVGEYPDNLAENPLFPDPPVPDMKGLETEADTPNITKALFERGFTESEIQGILGENLLDVFERTWE